MNQTSLYAFSEEMQKIAGFGEWWQRVLDFFRGEDTKSKRRVDYFHSGKAGKDRWNKFPRDVASEGYLKQLKKHEKTDDKLKLHATSMHELSKGKVVGKIQSSRLPGRTYEIKKISGGLGCTCNDWRFKGSVTPGYACKHIRAYKEGKLRA